MWWGICTWLCYKFHTESTSEKILKIGQYLVKLWARVRCLVFLTHGVVPWAHEYAPKWRLDRPSRFAGLTGMPNTQTHKQYRERTERAPMYSYRSYLIRCMRYDLNWAVFYTCRHKSTALNLAYSTPDTLPFFSSYVSSVDISKPLISVEQKEINYWILTLVKCCIWVRFQNPLVNITLPQYV